MIIKKPGKGMRPLLSFPHKFLMNLVYSVKKMHQLLNLKRKHDDAESISRWKSEGGQ